MPFVSESFRELILPSALSFRSFSPLSADVLVGVEKFRLRNDGLLGEVVSSSFRKDLT